MQNIDWLEIWEIIRDIVLPHIGRLVFNIAFFAILGLIISIVLLVIFGKKKILNRKNRIYTIIIRVIYIPAIIIASIFFGGQIGIIRGIYSIVKLENQLIVNELYLNTVEQLFSNNKEKEVFLLAMKELIKNAHESNIEFSNSIKEGISKQSKNASINSFSTYILKKYNEEVYSAVLYGLCYAANIKFDKKLNYSDFDHVFEVLMKTEPAQIEKSIKFVIGEKLKKLLYKQYISFVIPIFLSWLLIICIPLIEFMAYKRWFERRFQNKISTITP